MVSRYPVPTTPKRTITFELEDKDKPDVLLIAFKVFPETIDVAELIAPLVGPDTAIALFQNGVEIEEPVANAFPNNELISVIVMVGCHAHGPDTSSIWAVDN
jgi:2-dehydropantoate 2-reductase